TQLRERSDRQHLFTLLDLRGAHARETAARPHAVVLGFQTIIALARHVHARRPAHRHAHQRRAPVLRSKTGGRSLQLDDRERNRVEHVSPEPPACGAEALTIVEPVLQRHAALALRRRLTPSLREGLRPHAPWLIACLLERKRIGTL